MSIYLIPVPYQKTIGKGDKKEEISYTCHFQKEYRFAASATEILGADKIKAYEKGVLANQIETTQKIKAEIELIAQPLKKMQTEIEQIVENIKKAKSKEEKETLREAKKKKEGILRSKQIELNPQINALNNFLDLIYETEQKIRLYQTTDRALWLMAKSLADYRTKQNFGEDKKSTSIEINLENYDLSQLDNLLDETPEMSVKVGIGIIKETKRKIKDYGDLRKFAKDRRLPNFIQYFPQANPTLGQLDLALSYLETQREVVLSKAFDLEEAIHKNYKVDFQAFHAKTKGEHFEHNLYIRLPAKVLIG